MAALADSAAKIVKAKELTAQALAILNNPEATAEEKGKVEGIMKEAEQFKAEAIQMQHLDDVSRELEKFAGSSGGTEKPDSDDVVYTPPASNYKNINAYARALIRVARGGRPSKNLHYFAETDEGESKDLAESVGATGGFLVPTDFQAQLLQLMGESSIIRQRATIIRMRRRQLQIPVLNQTGTTAGQAHWFGGIQTYWTEEAATKTISDPSFRQVTLTAHKLVGFTRVSDELLDDTAISLTDFLLGPMGFAGSIAWNEDYAFFNGSGAGQPLGIINAPATITVARVDEDNIVYEDLVAMLENFLPSGNGIWVAHQSVLSNLLLMTGPAGNPHYVWGPGPLGQTAIPGVAGTLLGRPIIFTEKLPRISTTSVGDLMLIDPKFYLVGDRQATTLSSTIFEAYRSDQTSFRAVHRVDGRPWMSTPVTLADGTSQISPFVVLGAKTT